jgi:hypothetical protein
MDRNVRRVTVKAADGGTREVDPPPQDKLLGFFPAEALALYSGLDPLAKKLGEGHLTGLKILLWASLVISLVFCYMYLKRFWHIEELSQLLISMGALVLYVAALGGPFATIKGYDPLMGVAAAVIATAFLIFVKAPAKPV